MVLLNQTLYKEVWKIQILDGEEGHIHISNWILTESLFWDILRQI